MYKYAKDTKIRTYVSGPANNLTIKEAALN